MASYNAAINIVVSGQARLNYVLNSVEKLNALTAKLKPINLLAPGAGSGGDAIRVAKKQLDDFARAIVNFQPQGIQKRAKELSNTIAGASDQADALATSLANVGLKSGGFKQQAAEVKNYALALDTAARNAARLNAIGQTVQRGARVQNIATRFNTTPEQVEQRINNIRDIRNKKDKEAQIAAIRAQQRQEDFEIRLGRIIERNTALEKQRAKTKEAVSSGIIGGAFPLLFGQGPGAAIGGGVGGFAGGLAGGQLGFGLSLVGTAIGGSLDALSQSSVDLVKSLRQGGDAATYLENTLGYLDPTLKKQIQNLQNSGQTAAAAELAFQELARTVGTDGAKAFLDLGKSTEAGTNSLKRIAASFIAAGLAANKYFNDIKYGKDKNITDFLPQQFRPAPTPVEADQTAVFKQQTAELSKNNDILRLQVQLTSVSAKNDLDRFTTTQKQIAVKEYENELTKISIQLKNKEIDIEQNKLLITGANLNLSKKLGDIERTRAEELARRQQEAVRTAEEATRAAAARASALLQIEQTYYTDQLKTLELNIQKVQLIEGEEAAIRRRLDLSETDARIRSTVLSIERESALLEARKTGTISQVIELYEQKRKILQDELNVENEITRAREAQIKLDKFIATQQAVQNAVQPFQDFRVKQEQETQAAKTYLRLLQEGILPAEATRRVNFEKLVSEQLRSLDIQIATQKSIISQAEYYGVTADKVNELREALKNLEKARGATAAEGIKGPGEGPTNRERLEGALAGAKGELNELTDPVNQIIAGANAIGTAFQQAFSGLVSGAMTGQQALVAFFQGVGDHFMDMASKMIAKLIEIWILETVLGFVSGAVGGAAGGGFTASGAGFGGTNAFGSFDAGGAAAFNMPSLMAEGGFVTGPTSAIIGEGGESEYVIPSSKMNAAMSRYSRGARGEGVIAGSAGSEAAAPGAAAAGPMAIDVRYSVERINNVEYVTADQFQQGMQQAAAQGAQRGEQRALRSLQQSTAVRSRVGMR